MIYEYVCKKCGRWREEVQSIKAEPLTFCPICETHNLKRQISKSSFVLRGHGWANDGYSNKLK